MTMFFAKKLNKKGFTLAELLIVVAIIAVLVAIAIPLFNGALDKARTAAINANVRSIRAAAVSAILTKEDVDLTKGPWKAEATVDESGDITALTVTNGSATLTVPNKPAGSYVVPITALDLEDATTGVTVVS